MYDFSIISLDSWNDGGMIYCASLQIYDSNLKHHPYGKKDNQLKYQKLGVSYLKLLGIQNVTTEDLVFSEAGRQGNKICDFDINGRIAKKIIKTGLKSGAYLRDTYEPLNPQLFLI
uniref:Uncharacterized protein n=1 Tax=Marseillevirus LCMAC201 TaxID=2506605 RepID=A0A481YYK0_9VIRU|nr:MAG: hypothetical protein LCMAC201_05370 [Marseillevirus LCMAC201]